LNIDEQVIVKIPPLLPLETIAAIKERSAGNKTYYHGQIKNPYLLSRVVFCAECGNAMFGQTNHNNRRYYRHQRGRKTACNPGLWVRAEDLENAAMVQIFAMFGNPDLLKAAVERATPNTEKIEELRSRLVDLEKDLAAVQAKKDRLVDAVAEGIIPSATIKEKMDKLLKQEDGLKSHSAQIHSELSNLPDYKRQLSKLATRARIASAERFSHRPENLLKMTFEQKRKMIQAAFSGKDVYGNRLGVFVKKNAEGQWTYEIKGLINVNSSMADPTFTGKLPMEIGEAQDILGIDKEFSNINPLEAIGEEVTKYSYHCKAANLH
jgi:site-specific DNA recombinase